MTTFKPLREIITFKGGGTPSKQIPEYWNGAIPWATVKDFVSTSLDRTQDSITEAGLRNSSANLILKGHVVIPTRMSLGKAAINTIDIAINQDLRALIPKIPLDAHYLLHAILSLKGEIVQKGSGATVKGITQEALYNLKVFVPPLDDQKRIAHLLGKVERLITRRKQHLQQLDDLLKSVFLEMFGDPVRNEKGWETLPFNKIGKFISGGTPSKGRDDFWDGNFPWVSPKDMKVSKIDDSIDHISESVFKETSLKRIAEGHLLIVVRGMILAHSFPVAINTVEIAINQDMKAIKPVKGMNVIYLQNCLISQKRQILKLISTAGHGTRKFDSVAMQKLFIPKPSGDLQNQFATIVEKVESLKASYQQSLTDLESLYGAFSQKAFKGELDLSRVPLLNIQTLHADDEQEIDPVDLSQPKDDKLDSVNGTDTDQTDFFNTWTFHEFLRTRKDEVLTATDLWEKLQKKNFKNPPPSFERFKTWILTRLEQGKWIEQIYGEVSVDKHSNAKEKKIALRIRDDS
ncbi:MAG: restriction endonuclease subunit S [Pseudomonadota bacterium]